MKEQRDGPDHGPDHGLGDRLEDGAALWRRAREGWHAAAETEAEPDALSVAAYLEGRLDETGAEAVETWMAAEPEALKSVLSARAVLAEAPDPKTHPVPESMIARAQGVVRGRSSRGQARGQIRGQTRGQTWGSTWADALLGGLDGLLRPAAWAGAATVLLLVSVSGFELGRAGAEYRASLDAAVARDLHLVMVPSGQNLL